MQRINEAHWDVLRQWSPAFSAAGLSWLLLLLLGQTPLARASGLALAILGVTASMRPLGFVASIAGGLTLALCPVFWSQSGGSASQPATIVIALAVALVIVGAASIWLRRREVALGLGIIAFLVIFWSQVGTAQSLRLTGLVTAWLLFVLVDMLLLTNPRPGIEPAVAPKPWHSAGLLFLFVLGTINDPLVTLFAPAILLALLLSNARLSAAYWTAVLVIVCAGVALLARSYLLTPAPSIDIWRWREAIRWIELGEFLVAQFSLAGIALGVIGVARLARWYPPLGIVTMFAYGAFVFFGLVYDGAHREILLLPLVVIQVVWMTYAVNTFGQWVNKSLNNKSGLWIHLVSSLYFLLPLILLINILNS